MHRFCTPKTLSSPRNGAFARSCDLLLKATRGVTIAVVSSRERKRRQPELATDDPEFVGWLQLVRGIQGSQVHLDLVCGASENGGAAAGTEKPPGVVACLAIDRHRILREHRGGVKKGPMMLAAVETVTKADPVRASRRHNADVAAQATAGKSVHAASPLKLCGRNSYNEQHCHRNCPLRAGTRRSSVAGDSDHRFQANRACQMTLLQHRSVWVVRVAHKAPHRKRPALMDNCEWLGGVVDGDRLSGVAEWCCWSKFEISAEESVHYRSWSCKNAIARRGGFRGTAVVQRRAGNCGCWTGEAQREPGAPSICRGCTGTAARSYALIAAISNRLPTMFMTRVRL